MWLQSWLKTRFWWKIKKGEKCLFLQSMIKIWLLDMFELFALFLKGKTSFWVIKTKKCGINPIFCWKLFWKILSKSSNIWKTARYQTISVLKTIDSPLSKYLNFNVWHCVVFKFIFCLCFLSHNWPFFIKYTWKQKNFQHVFYVFNFIWRHKLHSLKWISMNFQRINSFASERGRINLNFEGSFIEFGWPDEKLCSNE